jgi:hypothetical protein
MMPIEKLFQALLNVDFNIWLGVKICVLLALGLYILFAFVVVRQADLMSKTLNGALNLPIKIIAWLLLFLTLAVFILALVVL